MNKTELIEFLNEHFHNVIVNDRYKNGFNAEEIKNLLNIDNGSIDEKCIINVSDIIIKTDHNKYLYFLYYSQKDSIMYFDAKTKSINIKLKNNVMKRYQYLQIIKRIKSYINKSNSYMIIFSNGNVKFNEDLKSHFLILNETNIDFYLNKYYDN